MKSALVSAIVGTIVALATISAIFPPKKDFFKPAIIGAILSFLMCWLMAYFVAPYPQNEFANALNNGLSGTMAGFVSSYVTIKGAAKAFNAKKSA
jgi:hypothetical protein